MATTFNTLDLIFFAFTAIFVITATFRGFIKEVFSLLTWVISLLISYLISPFITDFLAAHFQSRLALDLVSRSATFALVFIIIVMTTSKMRDELHDKMPRMFDRSLGLLFGFAKTLIIFGTIYSIYFNAFALVMGKESKKEPDWFEKAKCRSLIKTSGEILDPAIEKIFESVGKNFDQVLPKQEDLKDKIDEIIQEKSGEAAIDSDSARVLSDEELKKSIDTGYSKKNIEKMNQLIDVINK